MSDATDERFRNTKKDEPECYIRKKGTAGIQGHAFEYKLCALWYLRAKKNGCNFKLASNVEKHGAFDDIYLQYTNSTSMRSQIFVQLKSSTLECITINKMTKNNKDFGLLKYYNSFIGIEEFYSRENRVKKDGSDDESLFIMYTSADVERGLKNNKNIQHSQTDFLLTGGSVLQFNEKEHKEIYGHMLHLTRYREFLRRFRIFYGQAEEKDMDEQIKLELRQIMKLPENKLNFAYRSFRDIIIDWWQNSNYFLKENSSIDYDPLRRTVKDVIRTFADNILDHRKLELQRLGIEYSSSAITAMKQLIDPHKTVLIFAPGRSTTLTAAKIHQTLGATEHIILNLQQFLLHKSEVLLAWEYMVEVFVLEGEGSVEVSKELLTEISVILNKTDAKRKFIFVSNTIFKEEQSSAFQDTFGKNFTAKDNWTFKDITPKSKKYLLEKNVIFQGTPLKINKIVENIHARKLNVLDYDSVSLLLNSEQLSIGIPVENTMEYCYIDRKIECVTNDKLGIQHASEPVLQFRKDSLEGMKGVSGYGNKNCKIREHEQGIPQLSLVKEIEQDTRTLSTEMNELLCSKTKDEKHPFEKNNDEFGNGLPKLERQSTTPCSPSTLLDCTDRIMFVLGEPGMGKSTLLTHLAKQTRELRPDVCIVRVNINSYTTTLHTMQTKRFEKNDVLKLLTEAAQIKETEGAQLEKQLFNYIYNSTGNMVVLIDGVDEVSPHYSEIVMKILKTLNEGKIKKIWVTSRRSMKRQVQQEFKCQVYSLIPFSDVDQKTFIVKTLNQKHPDKRSGYPEKFAENVFKISSKYLSSGGKYFMGIPLQVMLLVEMFEEDLQKEELPRNVNLLKLCDRYVNEKWKVISKKNISYPTNVYVLNNDKKLRGMFIDNHKTAALLAILSTDHLYKLSDKEILKKGEKFLQEIYDDLEKTGIITDIIEGRPVFQNPIVAEYFVATWLCENIQTSKTFISDHLLESRYDGVRSMVDRILADKCPLHQAVLNSDMEKVAELLETEKYFTQVDREKRTPLHVAVSCRNPELVRLLLKHEADVSSVDTFFGLSPVQYASQMADSEMLTMLKEKKSDIREHVLHEMNRG